MWLTILILQKKRQFSTFLLIALLLLLGVFGYLVFSNKGMEGRRFNQKMAADAFAIKYGQEKNQYGRLIKNFMYDCDFYHFSDFSTSAAGINESTGIPRYCYNRGATESNAIFLWGDSHAQMLYYGLINNLPSDKALYQVSRAACKPAIANTTDPICNKTNAFALQELAYLKPEIVIVAQRDSWNQITVKEISSKLSALGVRKILFLGKSPEWKANLPKIILRKYWIDTPKRSFAELDTASDATDLAAKVFVNTSQNSQFIDLKEYFCNKLGCLVYLGDSAMEGLTSLDGNHLSPMASDDVAKNLLLPMMFGDIKSTPISKTAIQ
jgi:hypothetical protein